MIWTIAPLAFALLGCLFGMLWGGYLLWVQHRISGQPQRS